MLNHEDNPEAFFGFGRSGPKATKAKEKISIWQAVTDHKKQLKSKGEKVVDAIGDVADDFGYSETKVKKAFDEIQRYTKAHKAMNQGIAALLP